MSATFDSAFHVEMARPPIEVPSYKLDGFRHFEPGPTITFTITTKAGSEQAQALTSLFAQWVDRQKGCPTS